MSTNEPQYDSHFGVGSGIGEALFSKVRRKVLALFLLNPEKHFYFREAVRLLGDSPGSLQRELKTLTASGILTIEKIGIHIFYRANVASPVFAELRSIVMKTFGLVDIFKDVLRSQSDGQIEIAWIYGSVARAQDTSSSDIDVIVVGSLSFRELVVILEPIEKSVMREVNPTLYSPEEFRAKLSEENNFIQNVLESDKLFIIGDNDDLTRLVQ